MSAEALPSEDMVLREVMAGDSLPEDQQEVVELSYLHDYSVPEIADHLGISEEEVRRLMETALETIGEEEYDGRD